MMTERDILDAFASMPPRREPRSVVMSRGMQHALQVQGFDLSTGPDRTVFGYPIVVSDALPTGLMVFEFHAKQLRPIEQESRGRRRRRLLRLRRDAVNAHQQGWRPPTSAAWRR